MLCLDYPERSALAEVSSPQPALAPAVSVAVTQTAAKLAAVHVAPHVMPAEAGPKHWRRRELKPSDPPGNGGKQRQSTGSYASAAQSDSRELPHVPAGHDARHVAELAAAYLAAAARGEPRRALAIVLAEAVLTSNAVRLARAVLEDGDFALERATDLAETVLRSTAVVEHPAEASDAAVTSGGRL